MSRVALAWEVPDSTGELNWGTYRKGYLSEDFLLYSCHQDSTINYMKQVRVNPSVTSRMEVFEETRSRFP